MLDRIEPEVRSRLLDYAHRILMTDGAGRLLWSERGEQSEELAVGLDVVISAIRRMGNRHDSGALDSVMLQFEKLIVLVMRVDEGYIAVIADEDVRPGLLLIQARQIQAALSGSTGHA